MNDIQNRKDLQLIIENFYGAALADPLIGPVFKAANFELEAHIPVMVSFWETILFDVISYKGNPMLKHIALNQDVPLLPEHFERWMKIWSTVIQSNFEGPVAENAITRATSIAHLMEYKINGGLKLS